MTDLENMNVNDITNAVVMKDYSSIAVDSKREHGQSPRLTETLMTQMVLQSPKVIFGCLVWQHEGTSFSQCTHNPDGRVYCLGGQYHISACGRLKYQVASQGCQLPEFIE